MGTPLSKRGGSRSPSPRRGSPTRIHHDFHRRCDSPSGGRRKHVSTIPAFAGGGVSDRDANEWARPLQYGKGMSIANRCANSDSAGNAFRERYLQHCHGHVTSAVASILANGERLTERK